MACISKQDLANEEDIVERYCVIDRGKERETQGLWRDPCDYSNIIKVSFMNKKIDYSLMLFGVKTVC